MATIVSMKTTAAILIETGRPLEVADIEIPQLKPGQVLVQLAYSGVCHTQLLEARGYRGEDRFLPHCLGHEGSGTIIDMGPDTTKCRVDDRVFLSWIKGGGGDVPGSTYGWNGKTVNAGGVTTFMTHAVVSENRVTKLADDVDFPIAALIGCACATGAGSVWNSAAVQKGETLAVFGTGGVGLCAVAAGALVGAKAVIAVDVNATRLDLARQLGATQTIDSSREDAVTKIRELFPSGLDHAVEASGRPAVMRQALACVRARGGQATVIGNAHFGETLEINPGELNQGKRLVGTWGGDCEPDRDFEKISRLVASGQLQLDHLLGKRYSLHEVNEALADLESGSVARPLLDLTRV